VIDLTEYQQTIRQFYTPEVSSDLLTYSREALVAEVGEVIGLRAKRRRGDAALQDDTAYQQAVVLEMGDVLFSLASIFEAHEKPFQLAVHPNMNLRELEEIADSLRRVLQAQAEMGRSVSFLDINSYQLFGGLWLYALEFKITRGNINSIARANIDKLTDRQNRGQIRGSGHGEERK
jgi:NTP pyrophosphatase (non-canonical NTP hydrolase)